MSNSFLQNTIAEGESQFGEVTVEELSHDNYQPSHRNKLLAEAFYLMGEVEKYGTGFIRIRKELQDYPGLSTHIINDQGYFSIELVDSSDDTVNDTVNDRQLRILETIQTSPRMTSVDLSSQHSVSRLTILRDLEKLKSLNLLQRIGPDKSGKWQVLEEGKKLISNSTNDTVNDTVSVTVNDRQKTLLSLIEKEPQITISDLASRLGVTRLTVIRDIDKFKKNNIIKRKGSDKAGTWELI